MISLFSAVGDVDDAVGDDDLRPLREEMSFNWTNNVQVRSSEFGLFLVFDRWRTECLEYWSLLKKFVVCDDNTLTST